MEYQMWHQKYQTELMRAIRLFKKIRPDYPNTTENAQVFRGLIVRLQQHLSDEGKDWIPNTNDLLDIYISNKSSFDGKRIAAQRFSVQRKSVGKYSDEWLSFICELWDLPKDITSDENFEAFMSLMEETDDVRTAS